LRRDERPAAAETDGPQHLGAPFQNRTRPAARNRALGQ
jgi:hypothetical protein